jgi:hypothetical protein
MKLHDHSQIRYSQVSAPGNGTAYQVFRLDPGEHLGKVAGQVMRSPRGGWRYRLAGSTDWVGGFATRADAADHLLSAFSPSASWLI